MNLLNIFPVIISSVTNSEPHLAVDPWQVAEDDFPVNGSTTEKLKFLLNYAILAPSTHNTQPWLFKLVDDGIELYADKTRTLPIVDPDARELIISCGAALFNLKLAIRYFGFQDLVDIFPEPQQPDLLARIGIGHRLLASYETKLLFQALQKRRTNRQPFAEKPLNHFLLRELRLAASSLSTQLQIIPEDKRSTVIELITEGDRLQMANPYFRRELAQWIRPGNNADRDGIPAYAQGINEHLDAATALISLAIRSFDLGKSQSAKDRKLAAHAPILVLLTSRNDCPEDWLATGEALAHLLLRARVANVWASFFNQPIEVTKLRLQLQALFPETGYPQVLLRLGYAPDTKPTPRKTVNEVLLTTD